MYIPSRSAPSLLHPTSSFVEPKLMTQRSLRQPTHLSSIFFQKTQKQLYYLDMVQDLGNPKTHFRCLHVRVSSPSPRMKSTSPRPSSFFFITPRLQIPKHSANLLMARRSLDSKDIASVACLRTLHFFFYTRKQLLQDVCCLPLPRTLLLKSKSVGSLWMLCDLPVLRRRLTE
jgi:hypothetical protein